MLKPSIGYRFGVVVIATLAFLSLPNALLIIAIIFTPIYRAIWVFISPLVGITLRIFIGIGLKIIPVNTHKGVI